MSTVGYTTASNKMFGDVVTSMSIIGLLKLHTKLSNYKMETIQKATKTVIWNPKFWTASEKGIGEF